MARKHKELQEENLEDLSIIEAVENLSQIADLEENGKIEITEDYQIHVKKAEEEFEETWAGAHNRRETEEAVKDSFRTVLSYVKDFYKKEYTRFYEDKNQEGIRKIMVLVGEASEKLDKCTNLFKDIHSHGVQDVKEYRQLENFYKSRLAVEGEGGKSLIGLSKDKKGSDESLTGKTLSKEEMISRQERILTLGIEDVKADKEYELFFLQREDGTYFLNQNLLREIRLICQFGMEIQDKEKENPLERIKNWYDSTILIVSKMILKELEDLLKDFFQESMKYKDMELVATVNKACMALMLSANTKNLIQNKPKKVCRQYFNDFIQYFREAITSEEYKKLQTYPPPSSQRLLNIMMELISEFAFVLFEHGLHSCDVNEVIADLIEEGETICGRSHPKKPKTQQISQLWEQLRSDYKHINLALQNYPNGPVYKVLESIQESYYSDQFDTLMQDNIPSEVFYFNKGGKQDKLSILRLPSPTHQELVQHVHITDEFKALLDRLTQDKRKLLLINLQDRNSWREYNRSIALEQLAQYALYTDTLYVITLTKDSEFYHQEGNYKDLDDAQEFKKIFKEQLDSPDCGYYFSPFIKKQLFGSFIDEMMDTIHRFFFFSKKILTNQNRQNFIELFYYFLTLKCIDIVDPYSMSFTCKDGIDVGSSMAVGFFTLMKMIDNQTFSSCDMHQLYMMIFAIPLFIRERTLHKERFNRMVSSIQSVQNKLNEFSKEKGHKEILKEFGKFYKHPVLEWKIHHASLRGHHH